MIVKIMVNAAVPIEEGKSQKELSRLAMEKYELYKKEGIYDLLEEATKAGNKIVNWQRYDKKQISKMFPGITKEELERKIAGDARKWQEAYDKVNERVKEVFQDRPDYKILSTGMYSMNTDDLAEIIIKYAIKEVGYHKVYAFLKNLGKKRKWR